MDYLITQLPLFIILGVTIAIVHLVGRVRNVEPLPVTFPSPKTEALVALIPLLMLTAFVVFVFWRAAATPSAPDSATSTTPYTFGQALRQLLANLIIFLPFAIVMLIRRQGLKTIGLTRHNLAGSLIIGITASVAAVAVYGLLSAWFWFSPETLNRLVAHLGVGFSEEAIFRGFLQIRFSAWLGAQKAGLLTAVIFTLAHIPQRIFNAATGINLVVDLLLLLVWGLVFSWAMHRTGNIVGLSILHAAINVVAP